MILQPGIFSPEKNLQRLVREEFPESSFVWWTGKSLAERLLATRDAFQQVLTLEGHLQVIMYFLAAGALSAVSDNVFVGTVYITEAQNALAAASISREQFDMLAVAINVGTNVPSVATPNGQAAFLFLLTSALAPVIRLSYGGMVWMALPYAIVMTLTALLAVSFVL